MSKGRRCDLGCDSWPDDEDYKRCPICGEETTRYNNLRPLPEDEARSVKAHHEFEAMYSALDRHRDGEPKMNAAESRVWDDLYPGGRPSNYEEVKRRRTQADS